MPESFVYRVSTSYGLDLSAGRLLIVKATRRGGGKGAEHSVIFDAAPGAATPDILPGIQDRSPRAAP